MSPNFVYSLKLGFLGPNLTFTIFCLFTVIRMNFFWDLLPSRQQMRVKNITNFLVDLYRNVEFCY